MFRRGVGGLPLQRSSFPRIATRFPAAEITDEQVIDKHQLDSADNKGRNGDARVQAHGGFRDEISTIYGVIPARYAQKPQVMHRIVNGIGTKEGDPKVKFAQGFVHHTPGDLGIPMVDRAKHYQHGRYRHDHMEVGDHEHRV